MGSEEITAILVAFLGGSGCAALVSGITALFGSRKATKEGIKELLRDRIKTECLDHIKAGYIYMDDLEDLMRMFDIYHEKLKGNGYLDRIMKEIEKLPLKDRYN